MSNGQKNILRRIRRIREFWHLSGASGVIAFLLTCLIGIYCLAGGGSAYALEELPTGFGFGVEVFDYNTYHAQQYKLKSPLEAAYGYGLGLTGWPVSYEWLYLTDQERAERQENKFVNEEDGITSRHDFYHSLEDNNLLNELVNHLDEASISIYNMSRRADGTYQAILRLGAGRFWTEDHLIRIGVREGRYTVLSDQTFFYMSNDVEHLPLPYHAAVYEADSDEKSFTVDYRMDCQIVHRAERNGRLRNWTERRLPEKCVQEIRYAQTGGQEPGGDEPILISGETAAADLEESVLRSAPGEFEWKRTVSGEEYRLTESYGYRIAEEGENR